MLTSRGYREDSGTVESHHTATVNASPCLPPSSWLLQAWGSDSIRAAILSACSCGTAAALRTACPELLWGACDGQGRLLVGSASLPASVPAASLLRRLSPHLLRRLQLQSAPGDEILSTLMTLRHELCELRDVSIHLAAPSLPRIATRRHEERHGGNSVLARALARALPPSITNLAADLRGGGGMLAGDVALADFSAAIPRGLVRLRLDLNKCNAHEIRSVASVLPETLQELELHFHSRRHSWLSTPAFDGDDGLEMLARNLPERLERLALRVECADAGAGAILSAVPATMKDLDIDLRILMPAPRGAPAKLPEGLVVAMGTAQLVSLHLRLTGWALTLSTAKAIVSALPSCLQDLRLDLAARNVGDAGAELLAEFLPRSLAQLALCLRGWCLTDHGVELLSEGIATADTICRLMLLLPGCRIGVRGACALTSMLLPNLSLLNLSLCAHDLGAEGEVALQPLLNKWRDKPGSWVRCETDSVATGARPALSDELAEWSAWDNSHTVQDAL